ncbi:hypothetical protein BH11ARM2_BH11ARM2_29730 [soil metagenome]
MTPFANPQLPLAGPFDFAREVESDEPRGIERHRLILTGDAVWTEGELDYATLPTEGLRRLHEIQVSAWDRVLHAYQPAHRVFEAAELTPGRRFVGPIFLLEYADRTRLLAYEHGSESPDAFLGLEATDDALVLRCWRGDRMVGEGLPWRSVPILSGTFPSPEAALRALRDSLWRGPTMAPATRRPFVEYNTWNRQERQKYFKNLPYLTDLNLERVLEEIEVAHRLGVDVYTIDTGWYAKTGDWRVDLDRFPDGLHEVRRALEARGMRLGLWFDPQRVARSSSHFQAHPEWQVSRGGQLDGFHPVWETEESTSMCLCTPWADAFADELIRLHREVGVTVFKWDAVGLYGCDAPRHGHGDESHSPEERRDRAAFLQGERFERIVGRLLEACPEAVVDFDATDGGRFFGLGFLRYGRYFLMNNGPYFADFDIPREHKREPDTINVFFNPGPAHSRTIRTGLALDPYLPGHLCMSHLLPDGDARNQRHAAATLALGPSAIWGDLLALSEEEVAHLGGDVARVKRVIEGAASAYPRTFGFPGGSPEIHEKLDPTTGRGVVSFFTLGAGRFEHVTQPLGRAPINVESADDWRVLEDGRIWLSVELGHEDARLVTLE